MNPNVQVEIVDTVTVVTLNRPQVCNAVDAATARELHEIFLQFDDDPASPVAVFHGAHGHFCAGWDLQAGAQLHAQGVAGSALTHLEWAAGAARPLGPMGPSRLLLSKPVIAAVSGAAVAGGMELALWCDLRVMEPDAYFGVYCRRFGVPLIDGGTVRLPRLIGLGHAMDLILTGRKVEADEARRIGLCNRIAPPGGAREAALALARQLAGFPQATMNADRLSALRQAGLPLEAALQQEWAGGRACLDDALAGAARFAAGEGRHGKF
ncbi:MAG: crotonase/enoyl-CoA hydratase family protein [Burkholderiaceae bacterium]|nr:crotonase/enoyl-CoA hydratase family protein [Burkholderiaceae bacterium]